MTARPFVSDAEREFKSRLALCADTIDFAHPDAFLGIWKAKVVPILAAAGATTDPEIVRHLERLRHMWTTEEGTRAWLTSFREPARPTEEPTPPGVSSSCEDCGGFHAGECEPRHS